MVIRYGFVSMYYDCGFGCRHCCNLANGNDLGFPFDFIYHVISRVDLVNLSWRHTFFCESFCLFRDLFTSVFEHHAWRSSLIHVFNVDAIRFIELDVVFFQISGVFWDLHDILEMYVLNCGPILFAKRAFVSVNFGDESRVGVRLPIWTPPSSLTLSRISKHHLISDLNSFRPSMPVS